MDIEPARPAGSRRARVALLVTAAVLLLAAAGVGAALRAAGGHDRQPGGAAGVAAAGATVGGQDTGATPTRGGSGGQPALGGGAGGGTGGQAGGSTGGGGTPRTTTSRPTTTTQATSTTLPPIVVQGASWSASESCYSGPDGVWHYVVQFHVTVDSIGVGKVRYQWGRGADDARSDAKAYDIGVAYAYMTVHVWLSDTIKGSADAPTETVIDRLHVLDPPSPNGHPFVAAMVHKICP
jgi:hypothetical protein